MTAAEILTAAAVDLSIPGAAISTLTPWGALLLVVVGVYSLIATGKLIPVRTHDSIVGQHLAATASAERARDEWRELALGSTRVADKLADGATTAAVVLQKADRLDGVRHDEA